MGAIAAMGRSYDSPLAQILPQMAESERSQGSRMSGYFTLHSGPPASDRLEGC